MPDDSNTAQVKRRRLLPDERIARLNRLLPRYAHQCANPVCGKPLHQYVGDNHPTLDHILPLSRGGEDIDDNIRLLCGLCHGRLNRFNQCLGAVACSFATPRNKWATAKLWVKGECDVTSK